MGYRKPVAVQIALLVILFTLVSCGLLGWEIYLRKSCGEGYNCRLLENGSGWVDTFFSPATLKVPPVEILKGVAKKTGPLLVMGFSLAFYILKISRMDAGFSDRLYKPARGGGEPVREPSAPFSPGFTGEMIGAMAHDIRNPLAVIRASAELSKATGSSYRQADLLENIIVSGTAIEKLIEHYLNLIKSPRVLKEEIKLGEMFRSLVPVVNSMLALKKIRMEAEVSREMGGLTIYGDPMALIQLFLNLLSNAIEATPEGGLVKVSLQRKGGLLMASISDTGNGIPEAIRPRVFDRFFTTKGRKGVGLGLPLVKRVVADHGGEIWFQSEVGKGTTFFIRLPLTEGLSVPPSRGG